MHNKKWLLLWEIETERNCLFLTIIHIKSKIGTGFLKIFFWASKVIKIGTKKRSYESGYLL